MSSFFIPQVSPSEYLKDARILANRYGAELGIHLSDKQLLDLYKFFYTKETDDLFASLFTAVHTDEVAVFKDAANWSKDQWLDFMLWCDAACDVAGLGNPLAPALNATLNDPINTQVKTKLESQIVSLKQFDDSKDGDGFRALIDDIKSTISLLKPPKTLQSELKSCFNKESLAWPGDLETSEEGQEAWKTICAVWASKYNERAVLSCKKAGLNHDDLNMAVLCQPVVNAKYAFVLHTVHPQTNDQTEIYGELVCGMGEALVGNFSGRALSFTVKKSDLDRPIVNGFPSKSKGLFMQQNTLIFRSDSNGEDLEGFAGAGLYDSICMNEASLTSIDYANEPISNNEDFRNQMLSAIAKSGMAIENLLDSAQDIEGAITEDGKLFVVQTRPQVF